MSDVIYNTYTYIIINLEQM